MVSVDKFITPVDDAQSKKNNNPRNTVERYSIRDIALNEWKNFALYTVENRAIPNIIDGLKPSQRFYLYSSLVSSPKSFEKVSAIAGVVSRFGYAHGEGSAGGSGQLLAADWNNNICLIKGRGGFGTRLLQVPAAHRYTYTKVHDNFYRFFKDIDLAPVHSDPEHEPPAFYIPVIPMVLVNGVRGIATGFATNILPRDPNDLAKCCLEFLSGKPISKPRVKFPQFKGAVLYEAATKRYTSRGTFTRQGSTVLQITEVPYGYDRVSYIEILDKLEEDKFISSYEDMCDANGFSFRVRLKSDSSAKWSDDEIIKRFKLEKNFSDNLTVIGVDGKIREFNDETDIIKEFCVYRLGIMSQRIAKRLGETKEAYRWLAIKRDFVQAFLDDKIIFKKRTTADVKQQIKSAVPEATEDDMDRLLRMNIMSLTQENVSALDVEIETTESEIKYWEQTSPEQQFEKDILEAFKDWKGN